MSGRFGEYEMNAKTSRTGLRRSPHTVLAILFAIMLFVTSVLASAAIADESSTEPSPAQTSGDPVPADSGTPDVPADESSPEASDPPASPPASQSPVASSAVPSPEPSLSPAPTSAVPSGDQEEPADVDGLGPNEGILAVRVISSVDGREVVDVGARISKAHDSRFTRLPASMVLEGGEYFVEVMDVPHGYSAVTPMSRTATVVPKKRLTITLVATPVSGPSHPHPVTPTVRPERVPIKSIPSGRIS